MSTNKQEDYSCQRRAKELGSHPCQSKDRFFTLYFLSNQQQKTCTFLAASSDCFSILGPVYTWFGGCSTDLETMR